MLNNSHKMPNNTRNIAKKSLKFDSFYNNCLWIFNSTHKRIVNNILKNPETKIHAIRYFPAVIICGPHQRSFAIRDHLRSNLGIISGLGIICGRVSFAYSLWRRANARNVSFSISVGWSIYIINSVDKPNFRVSFAALYNISTYARWRMN